MFKGLIMNNRDLIKHLTGTICVNDNNIHCSWFGERIDKSIIGIEINHEKINLHVLEKTDSGFKSISESLYHKSVLESIGDFNETTDNKVIDVFQVKNYEIPCSNEDYYQIKLDSCLGNEDYLVVKIVKIGDIVPGNIGVTKYVGMDRRGNLYSLMTHFEQGIIAIKKETLGNGSFDTKCMRLLK